MPRGEITEENFETRLTLPYHPWTNRQVERMNRSNKVTNVKEYDYKTHDQIEKNLKSFIDAYNFAKRVTA